MNTTVAPQPAVQVAFTAQWQRGGRLPNGDTHRSIQLEFLRGVSEAQAKAAAMYMAAEIIYQQDLAPHAFAPYFKGAEKLDSFGEHWLIAWVVPNND